MNSKVANLIAVQFGIIIGLAAWLVYYHLTPAAPHTTGANETVSERPAAPVMAVMPPVVPASTLNSQRPYANYPPQVVQPQMLEQQPVATDQDNENENDQETATQPSTNAYVGSNDFSATPNYYDPVQQPDLVPSDYYYDPLVPYYYVPSQVVVINDNHHFRDRFRSHHANGQPGPVPHQFPRQNQIVRSAPPPPAPHAIRPPANVRPVTVQNNVRPRRAAAPSAPRPARSTSFMP